MLFLYIALNIALEPDYLYNTGIELDLIDNHIPSVKCPACAFNGQEVWVIKSIHKIRYISNYFLFIGFTLPEDKICPCL